MPTTFRKTLQFYLIDCKTAFGKIIDIFIIILNLFICLILVIETYPVSEATRRLLWQLEVVIVVFFIVEYVARLYAAQNRARQLVDVYSIIDLIAHTFNDLPPSNRHHPGHRLYQIHPGLQDLQDIQVSEIHGRR